MNLFSTRDLYMEACHKSKDLHAMTDDERTRLQAHLRKMYVEIEKVCDRHNLTVMLAYGSVLGAMRHKGFIPWDDDIDLFMPRADYDKLINLYADELPQNYKIYAPNSKNGPIARFAKVVDVNTRFVTPGGDRNSEKSGIFVDIFPLENAPKGNIAIKWQQFKACLFMYLASSVAGYESRNKKYKTLMCTSFAGSFNYYFRNALGFLFSWKKSEFWNDLFDRMVTNHSYSGAFSVPTGGPALRYFLPVPDDVLLPVRRVKFDDIEAYIPHRAEKHLEDEYGDWHQIPPENKRWMHFIEEIRYDVKP